MATRMQQRRGTAAQWTAANPILAAGEIGFETDTNKFKMGNGSSAWAALQYFANAEELSAAVDAIVGLAPETLDTLAELASAIGDDPDFFTNIAGDISSGIDAHNADQTNVHGIANTALLATQTDIENTETFATDAIAAHAAETTNVHGIDDTSLLAKTSDVETAISTSVDNHNTDTTNVHGITDTAALATNDSVSSSIGTAVDDHNSATENVHGIADTSLLATQDYVTTSISNSAVNQSALAGVGIDWNAQDEQFDIDNTVATKTYADGAVSTHASDSTNVHGIADTSALATTSDVATAKTEAIDAAAVASENYADGLAANYDAAGTASGAVTAHNNATTSVHGIADTSKLVTTDAASTTLDGNLTVEGDLTVNGTNFAASATSITIEDNMVQLAHQNSANTVDLGLVVAYNDGTAKHSGIVRDVSADSWKLFKGVTSEPSTTVDFTQGSLDDLAVKNITAAGVVFTDGTQTKEGVPSRTPIVQKTASYTLAALTERDSLVEVSSSSATTLTIPTNSSVAFPVGTSIDILQTSTGQVTIAGAAGVTVNATPGLKLRTQWSSATLFKRAENTWVVYGDLTA
jgi:hypothetical protein